jgi:hypothetical protein
MDRHVLRILFKRRGGPQGEKSPFSDFENFSILTPFRYFNFFKGD